MPKLLKPATWGQDVLREVLAAIYEQRQQQGLGIRRCTDQKQWGDFLTMDTVYRALRSVLVEKLLPLHHRDPPAVRSFLSIREVVLLYKDSMDDYIRDWLQMAMRVVRYTLEEVLPGFAQ